MNRATTEKSVESKEQGDCQKQNYVTAYQRNGVTEIATATTSPRNDKSREAIGKQQEPGTEGKMQGDCQEQNYVTASRQCKHLRDKYQSVGITG